MPIIGGEFIPYFQKKIKGLLTISICYTQSTMHIVVRRALFSVFLLAFLLGAPALVLYTAGYRYSIKTGQLARAGVLSITTLPRNVSIHIDDNPINKSTPYVVKQLFPGDIRVGLEREGFHTWTNTVSIYPGQTTYLSNILLLLDQAPESILAESFDTVVANHVQNTIAFSVEQGGWHEIWFYNIENQDMQLIDRYLADPDAELTLEWSAEGKYLLATYNNQVAFYTVSGKQLTQNEFNDLAWETVFWHPTDDNLVYLANADMVQEVHLDTGLIRESTGENASTILIDDSFISFVQEGDYTELRQLNGETYTILALLPKSDYSIVERQDNVFAIKDSNDNIFLIDIQATQPLLLQAEAVLYDWLENGDFVYSDGHEITVYNVHNHSYRFLTRSGEQITHLLWEPSGQYILFAKNNTLFAIEKEKQGDDRLTFTLATDVEAQHMWTGTNGKNLYFYGMYQGNLGLFNLKITR